MADDQKRQVRPPDDDSFSDALDDLFGPEAPADPAPSDDRQEPSPPIPAGAAAPAQRAAVAPQPIPPQTPPSYPVTEPLAPAAQKSRSFGQMVAIGCVAFIGLSFACMAALTIIGLVVGDGAGASAPQPAIDPAEASAEIPAEVTEPAELLIPLHAYGAVSSQWRVAVIGVIPDATNAVLERNMFNTEPDEDAQFFIATISVRNNGREPDVFPATLLLRAIGASGREYSTFDDFCGVIPDAYAHEPIAPGATVTGNICWSVLREDVDSLVMRSAEFSGGFQELQFALYE